MRKIYLLQLLLLFSVVSVAQQKEVLQEKITFGNSRIETINKGRSVLLDKFLEQDFEKVKEVKDSLQRLEDKDYLALFPAERWLIYYWTKEYQALLQDVQTFTDDQVMSINNKVVPQQDMLFEKLREKTRVSSVLLASEIEQTDLLQEQKDVLEMHLLNTIAGDDYSLIRQDSLNQLATTFLKQYPESSYATFTRQYIRYELTPSKWGLAFEFFSGYGLFTDELTNSFKNNVPVGVAFDIYYKNLVFHIRDYIGISSTKEALPFQAATWEQEDRATVYLPEASVGYVLLDSDRFKFIPFAGISSMSISPSIKDTEKKEGYEDIGLDFTTTYTLGASLDLKLGKGDRVQMVANGPEQGYWFLRFRYAYNNPQFSKKYQGYKGDMHSFTIGIGGFGRKLKRQF